MTRDQVAACVQAAIAGILPSWANREIPGDKHLRDLGADSVDRLEIIFALQDRLGLREPMSRFSELPDTDALIDFLHRNVNT